MKENISEEDLAVMYADGDSEALGELLKRCKSDLFGFLFAITGHSDVAEDIFQEVFLKFAEKPGMYKPKHKFRAWLFSVARNAASDYFRKIKSRREIIIEYGNGDFGEDTEGSISLLLQDKDSFRPDAVFENSQLSSDIHKALSALPAEQREIFYLRHYSGLSFKEISEMTGVPLGTLLSRMSRAAVSLRSALEKAGYKAD